MGFVGSARIRDLLYGSGFEIFWSERYPNPIYTYSSFPYLDFTKKLPVIIEIRLLVSLDNLFFY